jgi:hypothetical protein
VLLRLRCLPAHFTAPAGTSHVPDGTPQAPRAVQGVAGIVAAMVPCLRLYAYLACQLAAAFPFADHEYTGGWALGLLMF